MFRIILSERKGLAEKIRLLSAADFAAYVKLMVAGIVFADCDGCFHAFFAA